MDWGFSRKAKGILWARGFLGGFRVFYGLGVF